MPEEIVSKDLAYASGHTVLSPDKKLLAISWKDANIFIYDVESKQLRQRLDGTGSIEFRPEGKKTTNEQVENNDAVADEKEGEEEIGKPAYALISSVPGQDARRAEKGRLILWELDKHGRLLVEEERLDVSAFAAQAIDAIAPELESKHEWSREFLDASNLREKFEEALGKVAADHRRRHNTTLEDAQLGSFGASAFSPDGKYLIYHHKNMTTQRGKRDPEELPHVIVWDIDANKEVHRLGGHTDYISYSSFSPNSRFISSVSWDGTLRLYDSKTGELCWATENSGGQSWSASFTPDSKHIVYSAAGGRTVQIHDVATSRVVATFPEEMRRWCRDLVWHPNCELLALSVDRRVYVWKPFDNSEDGDSTTTPTGVIYQHFEIPADDAWRVYISTRNLKWLQDGKKLAFNSSEETTLVWDSETNSKELFKRPAGKHVAWTDGGIDIIGEGDGERYVSFDGDGLVRFWEIAGPAEKEVVDEVDDKAEAIEKSEQQDEEKKAAEVLPKQAERGNDDDQRNIWAEKGAGIWTAE